VSQMEMRGLLKARPGGGLVLAQEKTAARSKVEIADPDGHIVTAERNDAECALDWLLGRKDQGGNPLVSEEQFAAGEKLRSDYTLAQIEQRMTANWDRPIESGARGRSGSSSRLELSDRALAAKQRLFAALSFVGPELS